MPDRDHQPEEVKTPFQQIKWAAMDKEKRDQTLYNIGFHKKERRDKYNVNWDKLTPAVQLLLMNSL